MPHQTWEIFVGSKNDERLCDRSFSHGRKAIYTYKLPVRGRYLIEARGYGTAIKKALALAAADGIGAAIVKGGRRMDVRGPAGSDGIFDGLMGI